MARKTYLYAKTFPNGTKVKRTCKVCGSIFWITPYRVKKGQGKFCSHKCSGKWRRKYLQGKNHPHWKGGLPERICKTCGKKFISQRCSVKAGYGNYCSHRCAVIQINLRRKSQDTDIERLIEDELTKQNIPFTKQVPLLKITIVDFLLPKDIVVYCDGDYWHSFPERKKVDNNQNLTLISAGYKVFRFTGKEIKKSPKECIDKINYPNV